MRVMLNQGKTPDMYVSKQSMGTFAAQLGAASIPFTPSFDPDAADTDVSAAGAGNGPVVAEAVDGSAAAADGGDSVGAAAIWGSDTRMMTPSSVLTSFPWRAFGHLEMNFGSCSGTLVSSRHVITAGHCVHTGNDARDGAAAGLHQGCISAASTLHQGCTRAASIITKEGLPA